MNAGRSLSRRLYDRPRQGHDDIRVVAGQRAEIHPDGEFFSGPCSGRTAAAIYVSRRFKTQGVGVMHTALSGVIDAVSRFGARPGGQCSERRRMRGLSLRMRRRGSASP